MAFAHILIVTVLCAVLGGSGAQAIPIAYDEAVDGDLEFASSQLNFDVGVNTVTGNSRISSDPSGLEIDTFRFTLPVGAALTDVEVVVSAISTFGNSGISINPNIQSIPFGTPAQAVVGNGGFTLVLNGMPAFSLPSTFQFQGQFPLSDENYLFSFGSAIDPIDFPSGASFDYQYSFTVVPEPGTALLLGIGLVGIAMTRRN